MSVEKTKQHPPLYSVAPETRLANTAHSRSVHTVLGPKLGPP